MCAMCILVTFLSCRRNLRE